jgi:hypothetical protein
MNEYWNVRGSIPYNGIYARNLAAGTYRVRVITQFSAGSALLKEPRHIDYEVNHAVS